MSTRFFLIFVSLSWTATYADPQTWEQKQVAKHCAGVPPERIDALREFVKKQPKDASHGRVVRDARAWAKPAKDEVAISDGCVAAVVREILAPEGRTSEQIQAEARRKREAAVRAAWDALSETERRWIFFVRQRAAENRTLRCREIATGEMGYITGDDKLEVTSIASATEALVKITGECWINKPREPQPPPRLVERTMYVGGGRYVTVHESEGGGGFVPSSWTGPDPEKPIDLSTCFHDPFIWLTNVDTAKMANGSRIHLDKPILVSGTHSYESEAGALLTVFRVEVLDLDIKKLAQVVPPLDALKMGAKKP